MGLINLQTNLKNLGFGKDRPSGGSSNEPYIKSEIPESLGGHSSNQDFILRGGIKAVKNSLIDIERLGKFFIDTKSPIGLLFVAKQNILSRTAVRTQGSNGILNEGIYTPLSTLAEAGLVAFGGHLNKQGLNPFSGIGSTYTPNKYFDSVKLTNTSDTFLDFQNISILGAGSQNFSPINLDFLSNVGDLRNRLIGLYKDIVVDNSSTRQNVLSYQGGPGSVLGVGRTEIRFATDNNGYSLRTGTSGVNQFPTLLNPQQIDELSEENSSLRQNSTDKQSLVQPKVVDFRTKLRENLRNKNVISNSPSYDSKDKKTLELRTNLGDPGNSIGKNLTSYTNGYSGDVNTSFGAASPNSYDKINSLPLYDSKAVINDDVKNDLIKFRIGVIDNNKPDYKTYIHFRAFLDTISDSYDSDWKGTRYLGRGENFYTYEGFNRKLSLSWTVYAQSKAELIPMYKKLNYLASTCMPDYSGPGFMRGNIVTLTIGGYLYEQPGIITGFNYEMNDDNSTWEIAIDDNGNNDSSVKELPHMIKVRGFGFIPIHTFVPRKQQNQYGGITPNNVLLDNNLYGEERYIALANGFPYDSNNNNYGS